MKFLILTFSILQTTILMGQSDSSQRKIYSVNHWEVAAPLALFASSPLIFRALESNASLTMAEAQALDPLSINSFDRPGAYYDPANFASATKGGELVLTVAVVSPLLLLFDKRMRKDWADLLTILLVAHGADNALYYTSSVLVRRPRPLAFNPNVDINEKVGDGKTNSFFSGHTAWVATSTFTMAKLYTDYHHIKGVKRILIYTGASIPPAIEGYYRMQAGRHFLTDVMTGFAIGAICGIVVPELHRIHHKSNKLSIRPFIINQANGLSFTYTIK